MSKVVSSLNQPWSITLFPIHSTSAFSLISPSVSPNMVTAQGDLHDIGKNLVGMMLEVAGFEVIDLGVDVSPDKYAVAVKEHQPDLVACSALLTTTIPRMKDVVLSLKDARLRDRVKVMIGGAPVTDKYATDIGADGYAPDAASAASRAKELILKKG
jgi:5-methyltetrahydrofolate--homocysteine methyltransferase